MHQPAPLRRSATNSSSLPRVLEALKDLVDAEENNESRVKLQSKVHWFADVRRLKGSTILHVWKAVIGFTLWATVVAVADFVFERKLNLSNSVVPLLSVVVGLMLVFRNTTAFARWEDGRKSFVQLHSAVRSLSRDFWISIGAHSCSQVTQDIGSTSELRVKARYLRLLVAFFAAVKRHVRGQYGVNYEDLRALLPSAFYNQRSQPGFGFDAASADVGASGAVGASPLASTHSSTQPSEVDGSESRNAQEPPSPRRQMTTSGPTTYQRLSSLLFTQADELDQAISSSVAVSEATPLLRRQASIQRLEDAAVVVVHNYLSRPSVPLPLVIVHQLHLYLAGCKRKGFLDSIGPAGYSRLVQSLSNMSDLFGHIDGLVTNPVPVCYGIHLKQCTTLYLCALPLTLASDLGWALIPFVTIIAFTLVGIEALARECEDPFGTDPSDLPLDFMCANLRNEVEHLIARLGADPDEDLMT